jgi:arsenite methyltransferase
VELLSEDAQRMTFPDSNFDVIVSNLCLHNIPTAEGREKACREIARVLKPGGMAVISDFIKTAEYEKAFRAAGLKTERTFPNIFKTFPPLRIVTARK